MQHKVLKDLSSKELAPGVTMRSVYLKNVMVTVVELKEGSVVPDHSHPHEQISMILSGELLFRVDGEEKRVGPGESVLIPSNAKHGVTALKTTLVHDCWSPVREDYILDR